MPYVEFREYYAEGCPHCKALEPVWQGAKAAYEGPVNFTQVRCMDENMQPTAHASYCREMKAYSFPTMKLYRDNREISTYNGDRSVDALVNFARKHEHLVHLSAIPLWIGACFARHDPGAHADRAKPLRSRRPDSDGRKLCELQHSSRPTSAADFL